MKFMSLLLAANVAYGISSHGHRFSTVRQPLKSGPTYHTPRGPIHKSTLSLHHPLDHTSGATIAQPGYSMPQTVLGGFLAFWVVA